MRRLFPVVFLSLLFSAFPVFGHESTAASADIVLHEQLGRHIPADVTFRDETGAAVTLSKLIDKPAILAPVYLRCVHECPMLLTGLAQVLGAIDLAKPGKDFRVITLSFDEKDTPKIAAEKKVNYLKAVGRPLPADSWNFLTGDARNIKKFTDSIGFAFQRDGEDFSHPLTLVVIAPDGKIVRYLEGTNFLPFEVEMALTEAAQGRVGSATRKALMYCFSYDPVKKSYVFNVLKVTGTVMVMFVASFFAYLMLSTKKGRGSA